MDYPYYLYFHILNVYFIIYSVREFFYNKSSYTLKHLGAAKWSVLYKVNRFIY